MFIDLCIYEVFNFYGKGNVFFFIPILVWVLVMFGNKIFRCNISEKWNITTTIITFFGLCIVANSSFVNQIYSRNRFTVLTLLTGLFFTSLLMAKSFVNRNKNLVSSTDSSNQDLFNLFYINTSKVHKIVMLIDNKIMKTVEQEQVSEELLRIASSLATKTNMLSGEVTVQKEDNYKKTCL